MVGRNGGEERVGSKVLRKQDAGRQRAATKEKKIIFETPVKGRGNRITCLLFQKQTEIPDNEEEKKGIGNGNVHEIPAAIPPPPP